MEFYKPRAKAIGDLLRGLAIVAFFSILLYAPRPLWYQIACSMVMTVGLYLMFLELVHLKKPILKLWEGQWYYRTHFLKSIKVARVEAVSKWFWKGYSLYSPEGKRYWLRKADLSKAAINKFLSA